MLYICEKQLQRIKMKIPKRRPLTEKQIQSSIIAYLQFRRDVFFWRQNSGSFTEKAKSVIVKVINSIGGLSPSIKSRIIGLFYKQIGHYECTSEKGLPDIAVIKDGMYIGLEVKTKTGRQRDTQKLAQSKIEKAGGKYFIVRSLDEVKEIFDNL
jgi:hypothetical protein